MLVHGLTQCQFICLLSNVKTKINQTSPQQQDPVPLPHATLPHPAELQSHVD